ncbi:MAG: TetR/AcrR family transcriptional regulator [Bacilli bacterium]|nr:TetR/AcrR family transcriptional regulator [Bacilli bacterium]
MKDVREKIVAEFIAQFNVKGEKLTLDEVSKNLHMSKKTIYTQFRSKNEIYLYIIDRSSEFIFKRQQEIYENKEYSSEEKLLKILTIETPYGKMINFNKIFSINTLPEVIERLHEAYSSQWDYVRKTISDGIADGTIRPDVNIELIIEVLASSMLALYNKDRLSTMNLTYDEAVVNLVDYLVKGLVVR